MIYGGTSGYSFREWVGPFYPPRTPPGKYLAYYASRLNSVEINHTFRRFPTASLMASWAAETPESFRLSLKMHQSVTHRARLQGVREAVTDFRRALDPLGPRLGVVLFQLPPNFRADLERLSTFLSELPPGNRYALEFRHPSWNEPAVRKLLGDAGVALCAAEVEIGDGVPVSTAPFAYLRFRKEPPYNQDEMAAARRQIMGVLSETEDLFFYVKHDQAGLAPDAVLRLQQGESPSGP
jgi:uncharacterized protein YecE (DUF72 family)